MIIYCECCNENHNGSYGSGRFCSSKCARSFSTKKKRKEINQKVSNSLTGRENANKGKRFVERFIKQCFVCGNEIETTNSKSNETCKSKKCVQKQKRIAGLSSSNKRKKRSKDEIKLFNLLQNHYNIDHNKPIANGWDADVLLKDYKVAILWNGPWHYKEMGMTNHSLKQVANRDLIKISEFEKIGWEVLIYEDNKWTPEEAFIDVILKVGRR